MKAAIEQRIEVWLTSWRLGVVCVMLAAIAIGALRYSPGVGNDFAASYFPIMKGLLRGQLVPFMSLDVRLGYSLLLMIPYGLSRLTSPCLDFTLMTQLFFILMNAFSLYLFYKICRLRGHSAVLGLLGVILLALTKKFPFCAASISIDTLVMAWVLLSFYLLSLGASVSRPTIYYFWASVVAGLALWTKQNALGMIFPLLVIAWEQRRNGRTPVVNTLALLGPFLILGAGLFLVSILGTEVSPSAGALRPFVHPRTFWASQLGHVVPLVNSLGRLCGPILPLLAVAPGIVMIRRRRNWDIIAYLVSQWLIMFLINPYRSRYYLSTLPFVVLIAMDFPTCISAAKPWLRRYVRPLFVAAIVLHSFLFVGLDIRAMVVPPYRLGANEGYFRREVANWLNGHTPAGSIVAVGPTGFEVIHFYIEGGRRTVALHNMQPGETLRDFMLRTHATYLVYEKPLRTLRPYTAEYHNYSKWEFLDDTEHEHPNFAIAEVINEQPKVIVYRFK